MFFVILAWAIAALVLVQAALAGQFVNTSPNLVSAHRYLAEAMPLIAVGLAVLAWFNRRVVGPRLLGCSIAMVLLMVGQTGLGFAGRSSANSAAIHIPLGVALFGLAIYCATEASSKRHPPR